MWQVLVEELADVQSIKETTAFMQPEGSLPHNQKSAIGPYSDTVKFSQHIL